MNILFVASEGLPYAKSGGLADVVGSVPAKIQTRTVSVSVILPLYKTIVDQYIEELEYVMTFQVYQGMFDTPVRIFKHTVNGVDTYFVENQEYFERDQLYGYHDDGARFAFFQHAVMNFVLNFEEGFDVLHCHDWHTGMVPVLGKTMYKWHERVSHLKYVYTIHNLAFQGNFPVSVLTDCFGLTMDLMHDNSVNFHDGMSFMKGGIFYADKVTTVSETYAQEILTETFGERMDGVLRLRSQDLVGIVNGIDTKMWNPAKDPLIDTHYTLKTIAKKINNKTKLQVDYGLTESEEAPLFGMVSRLTDQKGVTLLIDIMQGIIDLGGQVFVLGTGYPQYEDRLAEFAYYHPDSFVYYKGYHEPLAHQIYAASDFFLMPSYFEPCGISQLISMRYGTLPIVRETGGLKDTVAPCNPFEKTGTGITFRNFSSDDFYQAVVRACDIYRDKETLAMLQSNAMTQKLDWQESAKTYRELYRSLL